jgi:competence protein ComEC
MPRIHFLNVGRGDCHIIEHGSNRVTMIDICGANADEEQMKASATMRDLFESLEPTTQPSVDYGMRHRSTNPIAYMKSNGLAAPFRFILSHPDCDHLDGFNALWDEFRPSNFWDNGLRKTKPDFGEGPYLEADWDAYEAVRDRKRGGVTIVTPIAGAKFSFANQGDPENRGDCLEIVAPDANLVETANESEDHNDGSYVIVYRSAGGKVIFPGDAHDGTWEYVLKNHSALGANCAVLIAPHHGRDSDRSHDFLDTLKPKLTLFGYADSEHLSYDAYNQRGLLHITNNQAGNVVMDANSNGIDVFVENRKFAETFNAFDAARTCCGSYFIGTISKPTTQ